MQRARLVEYDDSDDDSDGSNQEGVPPNPKKRKLGEESLPSPEKNPKKLPALPAMFLNFLEDRQQQQQRGGKMERKGRVEEGKEEEEERKEEEEEENGMGRIRSVPHTQGNWATIVFIPVPKIPTLWDLLERMSSTIEQKTPSFQQAFQSDLHISLSRTVYLKVFQIDRFYRLLAGAFAPFSSFHVHFDGLEIYVNDEKTRHFIGLKAKAQSNKFHSLTQSVDNVFAQFGLQKYYENPQFHASFGWSLSGFSPDTLASLAPFIEEIQGESFHVNTIILKAGNKLHSLRLL